MRGLMGLREVVGSHLAARGSDDLAEMPNWKSLARLPAVDGNPVNADGFRELLAVDILALEIIGQLHARFVRYPYNECKQNVRT